MVLYIPTCKHILDTDKKVKDSVPNVSKHSRKLSSHNLFFNVLQFLLYFPNILKFMLGVLP
jgi:hypothetical protein